MTNSQKRENLLAAKKVILNVVRPTSNGLKVGETLLTRGDVSQKFEQYHLSTEGKDCCSICGGKHFTKECKHRNWSFYANNIFHNYNTPNYLWKPTKEGVKIIERRINHGS